MSAQNTSTESETSSPSGEGWFYVRRGEPRGPVTERYLRALFANGDLAPEALVRGPGVDRWIPAEDVEALELKPPDDSTDLLPKDLPQRIDLEARGSGQQIFEEMLQAQSSNSELPEPDVDFMDAPELPDPLSRFLDEEAHSELRDPESAGFEPTVPGSISASIDDSGLTSSQATDPAPAESESGLSRRNALELPDVAAESPPPDTTSETAAPSPYDQQEAGELLFTDDSSAPASPYEQPEPEPVEMDTDLSLDDVLGEVERHREEKLENKRRTEIRRAARRQRFEQIADTNIKPALRNLMERLHARGYPTRLRDLNRHHIRFEFTLEARRVIRCTLEISLQPKGMVEFVFLRDLQPLSEEMIPLEELEADKIQSKIASFVKLSLQQ